MGSIGTGEHYFEITKEGTFSRQGKALRKRGQKKGLSLASNSETISKSPSLPLIALERQNLLSSCTLTATTLTRKISRIYKRKENTSKLKPFIKFKKIEACDKIRKIHVYIKCHLIIGFTFTF